MEEPKQILSQKDLKSLAVSPDEINERIERRIEATVGYYKQQNPEEIKMRIAALEKEWDIERAHGVNLSMMILISAVLSIKVSKKWNYLAGVAAVSLIQHAVKGNSLPFQLLRRVGLRTADEILLEKRALEDLLDDFN